MVKDEIPPTEELNKDTIEVVNNYNPDDMELGEDVSVEDFEMAEDISPDDFDIYDEKVELEDVNSEEEKLKNLNNRREFQEEEL